jgi:hypothetical protein
MGMDLNYFRRNQRPEVMNARYRGQMREKKLVVCMKEAEPNIRRDEV